MTLFDAYVFVDWSSKHGLLRQIPSPDGIWIGEFIPGTNPFPTVTYHRSRQAAVAGVLASLVEHVNHRRRVLVGFDFPYGYPAGWCRALDLKSGSQAAWLAICEDLSSRITDTASTHNNRFAVAHDLNRVAGQGAPGPFWGCPQNCATPHLQRTSPGFPFTAARDVIPNAWLLLSLFSPT